MKGNDMFQDRQASNADREWVWRSSGSFDSQVFCGGKYVLRNNTWGGTTPQRVMANSESQWRVEAQHPHGSGNVKGYPQLIRGWVDDNSYLTPRSENGMGIEVDQLKKARVYWKMRNPKEGRYMALWDIYLHRTPDPDGVRTNATNILVFQRNSDPTGGYGVGVTGESLLYPEVRIGDLNVRYKVGRDIVVWIGPHGEKETGVEELTFDLRALLYHFCDRGDIPRKGLYLTSVQAGFEIIEGGVFETEGLWMAMQDEPDGPI